MKTALSSHDSRDQSTKEEGREPNPDGAGPSSDGQTQSPEHCTLCRSSGVASGDWGLRYGHRPEKLKGTNPLRSRAGAFGASNCLRAVLPFGCFACLWSQGFWGAGLHCRHPKIP